jgi:hypothetical protein
MRDPGLACEDQDLRERINGTAWHLQKPGSFFLDIWRDCGGDD